MGTEGCWSWWTSLGTASRAWPCPCSQEQLVCRCALLPAQHQHLGEWHTTAFRHPCLETSPGSCIQNPPLLCSCSTQAVHHQHVNSRGSDCPCPMLRVWKQLMHKVPGNGAKNMLHVCSVEHATLSTQLFQRGSSNQPLQNMGFYFIFFPCTYFNIPEPQAMGGFSPILLQGQHSQLSYFW